MCLLPFKITCRSYISENHVHNNNKITQCIFMVLYDERICCFTHNLIFLMNRFHKPEQQQQNNYKKTTKEKKRNLGRVENFL